MGLLITPETPVGKESWKWEHHEGETHPSDPSIRGMRPRERRDYPAMLYKATQKNPWKFEQHTVNDAHEQRNMESRGFVAGGQGAAAEAYDQAYQASAIAAAVRNYDDRNISPAARAHVNAVEQSASGHLAEIPRTPVRKRRTKAEMAAARG